MTTESFVKAMNGLTVPSDIFGTPKLIYTATKRLGSESSRLSQIQDGKWKPVADGK